MGSEMCIRDRNKTPFGLLFQQKIRYPLNYDQVMEESNNSTNTFTVGQKVFVKPVNGRCDLKWPTGVVTKLLSELSVEVDGFPWHISHIRACPKSLNHELDKNQETFNDSDVSACDLFSSSVETVSEEIPGNSHDNNLDEAFHDIGTLPVLDSIASVRRDNIQTDCCDSEDETGTEIVSRPARVRTRPKKFEDFIM